MTNIPKFRMENGRLRLEDDLPVVSADSVKLVRLDVVLNALDGIDREEADCPSGWWETSAGRDFGGRVLDTIKSSAFEQEIK